MEKANLILEEKEVQEAIIEALKKDRDERIKDLRDNISKLEMYVSHSDLEKTNLKSKFNI